MKIIGISGKPGSGKDTLAKLFIDNCQNFKRISLGDRIREVTMLVTGLDMDTLRNHPEKDQPISKFAEQSGREITIEVGYRIEGYLGDTVWCDMTDRLILEEKENRRVNQLAPLNYVVPDIRTPTQANWIKERDGILIRIEDGSRFHKYEIENRLDDYSNWDCIIKKEEWFIDALTTFEKITNQFQII